MNNNKKENAGMYVAVYNNNVEKAMRQLKKKLLRDGLFNEIRERRYFKSNTEKRLKAEAAAAARHRRRQAKEDW
jgi:small subunit ribosomal protein S21